MERSSVPFHQCSYFFSTFQRSGGLVSLRPRNYDFYEKLKVKFSSVTRNALNEQSHIFLSTNTHMYVCNPGGKKC